MGTTQAPLSSSSNPEPSQHPDPVKRKGNSKTKSRSPLVASQNGSGFMRTASKYLRVSLPDGWEKYYSARRAGKYYGLSINCPVCGEPPPRELELKGAQRWRWLSVHLTIHNYAGRVYKTPFEQTAPVKH